MAVPDMFAIAEHRHGVHGLHPFARLCSSSMDPTVELFWPGRAVRLGARSGSRLPGVVPHSVPLLSETSMGGLQPSGLAGVLTLQTRKRLSLGSAFRWKPELSSRTPQGICRTAAPRHGWRMDGGAPPVPHLLRFGRNKYDWLYS